MARIIFYMATRYEGEDGELDLEVVEEMPVSEGPYMAGLSTLLEWNRNDPPDAFELYRNEVIYDHQHNRNPFIDHPEFADYIWPRVIHYSYDSSGNRLNRSYGEVLENPDVMNRSCIAWDFFGEESSPSYQISDGNTELDIYPNPTCGILNLEATVCEEGSKMHYEVYDLSGNLLKSEPFNAGGYQVHMESFPDGVYFLRININGESFDQKIVKQ